MAVEERIAEIMTLLSRCRIKSGATSCDCCQVFGRACPLELEKKEYWLILHASPLLYSSGPATIHHLLPQDVLEELHYGPVP